jgi:hypothetical protein
MAGRKGRRPNSKKRGSRFVTRRTKKGPNKGKVQRFRLYVSSDGRVHSTPQGKRHRP